MILQKTTYKPAFLDYILVVCHVISPHLSSPSTGNSVDVKLPHTEISSDVLFMNDGQLDVGMGSFSLLCDLMEYEPIASHIERAKAERPPAVTPC